MSQARIHFLINLGVISIGLFFLLPSMGVSMAVLNPPLFGTIAQAGYDTPPVPDHPTVIRTRRVRPDFKALAAGGRTGILILNLFEDAVYQGVVEQVQANLTGSTTYSGRLKNVPMGSFILVARDHTLIGTVRLPAALYHISIDQEGTHAIYQLDEAAFPPELEPIPVEPGRAGESQTLESDDDGSKIDVMVVYTLAARQSAGGTVTDIETLIDTAVAETNTGYQNSGVSQRLNLVHTEEVDYSESNFDWESTLFLLSGTSDGVMDNIHAMRDAYCADEVVLLVGNADQCGIAYIMQDLLPTFASNAFAVVSWYCATGYYSFGHELGHNMGSTLDWDNAEDPGVYHYSHGYQDLDLENPFRTIMAYDCEGGCPRLNYWSNPDITMYDRPMGVVYTDPLAADNRRSLNNTAYTVANFRASMDCAPYTAYIPLVNK
jgi:hypothetical protein